MIIHQISEIIKKSIQGEGGDFALIHKVRARSGLSRESFDRAIDYLAHSDQGYKIELMGGDPSLLTEQEITNCITKDGMLFITMAWREEAGEILPETVEEFSELESVELPEPEPVEEISELESVEKLPEPESVKEISELEFVETLPKPATVEKQPEPEPVFLEKRKIARAYPARGRKYRKIKQIPYNFQKIQVPGCLPRWMIAELEKRGEVGAVLEEILLQAGIKKDTSETS